MSIRNDDGHNLALLAAEKRELETNARGYFVDVPVELNKELLLELESVKKDNANLIEMNFNLEQQYSAIKEDLDQANDDCADWEDAYHRLEDKVEELLAALNSIEEIAQNR
jgi:predicted nuclease with TOPRIM domain